MAAKVIPFIFIFNVSKIVAKFHPKPNNTQDAELHTKSHVEELSEPSSDLYQVLTEENDPLFRWTVFTYPVHVALITPPETAGQKTSSASPPPPAHAIKVGVGTSAHSDTDSATSVHHRHEELTRNCTVAYMAQCMSWIKCKSACRSMGATSYRWFHDGCCECVGQDCINYGINESRCLECPLEDLEEEENNHGEEEESDSIENLTGSKHPSLKNDEELDDLYSSKSSFPSSPVAVVDGR